MGSMLKQVPTYRGINEILHLYNLTFDFFIAGGYARYCANPDPHSTDKPSDIDMYFLNEAEFNKAREYFKSDIEDENDVAIKVFQDYLPINLIKCVATADGTKLFGTVSEVLDTFDFTVCCAALTPNMTTALVNENFLEHLEARELHFHTIGNPIYQLKRIHKYLNKGYKISNFELTKLFLAWDNNPNMREVMLKAYREVNSDDFNAGTNF